ncbi:MAG: polysaccharide deacetylase family protein [Spirochaetia bacterium]|jgi:peptidoglycan/xylan/chitin deacetylase (PgdA/CDA1 family)
MKRRALLLAGLFFSAVAFSQAIPTMGTSSRRQPPLPQDGKGKGTAIVPILVYHSIRPYIPSDTSGVRRYVATPSTLEGELSWLKTNGFTSITFDDLARHLAQGEPLPAKPVIISFDDDWEGQYNYALPLLKKYGFTATFYIWVVVVGMKHHMTWDEVKELDAAGMQIGCHTLTHPFLQRIRSDVTLRREIVVAKRRIEEHIGKPVTSFAYPFGQYNARVVSFVREAGFTSARSTWPGVVHSSDGLFSLTSLIRTEATMSLIDTMTMYMNEALARAVADASTARGLPADGPPAAATGGFPPSNVTGSDRATP